ncbi:MAG: glycoside hydrolase family 2 TIM barrel-domain containing protein [Clostridia bacterium]
MKKALSLVVALVMILCVMPIVHAQQPYDLVLDGQWDFKYYADANDVPEDVTKIVFEDKIQVPGAMELQGYGTPGYYYETAGQWGMAEDDGVRSAGVYKIELPHVVGESFMLKFENVADELTVYVDGKKAGESKNGAMGAVLFSMPSNFKKNTIVCVVKRNKSGINKTDDFALSGIMGSVTVTNSISQRRANVDVTIKENCLIIDGKEVVLKGVKYTPTHPMTGNVITNEQIDKDLQLIMEYGFNAVWTSCAPLYFYQKAEKLGLYVIDEANVNLSYADRDMETAKKRIKQMIENHSYKSVIMWSVGSGDGNSEQLIEEVKSLDKRPVAQEVNFAPDFKVFGNTGGMKDWVKTLGEGNVGGFVDEFADKELYYTKNAYVFTVKDDVTGENVQIDGEITNYKGVDMLGKGTYKREVKPMDEFTVLSYISNANRDRVIFETDDKSIRLETIDYRIRLTAGGKSIDADGGEGMVAAVYADGEMQLFTSRSFKANMECNVQLKGGYTVGEGNGAVAIEYVKIYDKILTIDEFIEKSGEDSCISSVSFDNVTVNEDKSYEFLAYGGDFGDEPNSYYKCLTGLFTSTREPHPEAYEMKCCLMGDALLPKAEPKKVTEQNKVTPVVGESSVTWTSKNVKAEVDFEGKILSISDEKGERLEEAMYPTVLREETISEMENGQYSMEDWIHKSMKVENDVLYIELSSTVTEGWLNIAYYMTEGGNLSVSMQSVFSDNAEKPTFVGFRGVGDYDNVKWLGSKHSVYPDRRNVAELNVYLASVDELTDNYAIPQENGNRIAYTLVLTKGDKNILFTSACDTPLQVQVHNYSPYAIYDADHDEDIKKEDKAYFRIGGYIAGVSDNYEYKLTDNEYGYSFYIATNEDYDVDFSGVHTVDIDNERYKAFTPGFYRYVYRTNTSVKVTSDTGVVNQDDKKAIIGDYRIYFAPDNKYLSDMEWKDKTAQIAKDSDFNGNLINMRGNDYWAPAVKYEKGITLKNGSVTYDVSDMTNHVFNAVIGKNDFDFRSMGGRFDRNMFQASSTVTISLDGEVVYKKADVSMRSGSESVAIDVSDAKEMTITVNANGQSNDFCDAVLADAVFIPQGPIVINFEKKDGKAEITVLNTDKEYVDLVLIMEEEGTVTTEATRIAKGLYKTIVFDNVGDSAKVKAFVTGLGEVTCE